MWDALVPGPSDIVQEFWLGVAQQALVAAMHQHHHCPTGSIYVQKKPVVKVVVGSVPSEKFLFTPYPAGLWNGTPIGSIAAKGCQEKTLSAMTAYTPLHVHGHLSVPLYLHVHLH